MNKKILILSAVSLALLPVAAFAVLVPNPPAGALNLTMIFNAILTLIWALLMGFSVVMFIIAGFRFLSAQGEASMVKEAQQSMLWGVVGLIAAIVAFSLPSIITSFFGTG